MEALFRSSDYCREDLAQLLRAVQDQEKQNLLQVCNCFRSIVLKIYLLVLSFIFYLSGIDYQTKHVTKYVLDLICSVLS